MKTPGAASLLLFLLSAAALCACAHPPGSPGAGQSLVAGGDASNGPSQESLDRSRGDAEASRAAGASHVTFRDATRESGLRFVYSYPLKSAKTLATQGGGVALADYDGDGRLDAYFVGSVVSIGDWRKGKPKSCSVLFHNEGEGKDGIPRFKDVTATSGIEACGWGQGAYWVDIDGDGDPDLFQTNAGTCQLFINRGPGVVPRFEDRSLGSGIAAVEGFHIAAGFFDADRDGDVDIYLPDYIRTDLDAELAAPGLDLKGPEDYEAGAKQLLRNNGDGTFSVETEGTGLTDPGGKSLAVAPYDFNGDGWTDLYVANDRSPNALFLNNQDGSFTECAVENGCAVSEDGLVRSGMGIAIGDFDGDGLSEIFVTNYTHEWNTLYHALGGGFFEDATGRSGLGPPSFRKVGWGTGAIDYDNDGRLDLYVNNGNIIPTWVVKLAKLFSKEKEHARRLDLGDSYKQAPLLFHGRGDGTFENVSERSGDLGRIELVGRGSAAGDLDGDGDLDLVLVDTRGESWASRASRLLINEGGSRGRAIAIRPVPSADRRTVLGALVRVEAEGIAQVREWEIGPSFASGSDTPLWFGVGSTARSARVSVTWPNGQTTVHESLATGAVWRVRADGDAVIESRFVSPGSAGTF